MWVASHMPTSDGDVLGITLSHLTAEVNGKKHTDGERQWSNINQLLVDITRK